MLIGNNIFKNFKYSNYNLYHMLAEADLSPQKDNFSSCQIQEFKLRLMLVEILSLIMFAGYIQADRS